MKFVFDIEEYKLFKGYVDISELDSINLNDIERTVEIDESELRKFQIAVSDASLIYGFDSEDEITPFGRKLEALYDTVYYQSSKAPD